MIAIRMKKFYKKTRRRVRIDGNKPVGFDKKKLECFKCHNTGHFAREYTSKRTNDGNKRDSFYQDQGARKKEQNQNCLLTMDDGEQEVKILAYDQTVKKLEAQVVTFQKQQLSLNEQLIFQANELYEKDEKLKKYRRIGMKAVKEKEQLQKTVDSWKDSSKNLWKLVDSGMSSTSKVGLGYEIKSNDEVLSYEEEMNRTVFNCTEEDFIDKPLYSRFSKTDSFKGVPHPLTGDYTPKPQQEIDESLYVYGKKGPQKPEISDSDDKSNEHSTCQSNDSEGSFGNPSEHSSESESESISVPNEMSTSKSVTTNEKVVSESKEVEPSCVTHVKTPRQQMKNQETHKVNGKNWDEMMERKLGEGYSFIKKKCFVCGSLSHLIRDCDFYEKKMVREAELKKQRVFNTGNGVAKPVWNNANRVNHANHFVPRPVQLNTGRANVNSVRANVNSVRPNVNTGRANVNSVRQNVNSVRSNVNTGSFNINTVKAKQPINTSNSNSFSPVRPQDHLLKNMEDRGIFDSGCSGHITGNKDHLDDFEESKGGSVTFRGSKGYITGKGRIRHKVLFTETECVVVSPNFKMPDENQILLKVPRQHNMHSFDMKTPAPAKCYTCLIAKATSDESKLWHMSFKTLHDDEELSLHDDASLDGSVPASNKGDAPAKPPQIITTNTLSNIKLPVLQKDDYDTWAMEMEHYLEYIDNEEEQFAEEKERKARTLLLMAVPKDHLRRFHGMDDAKEIWAAIKTRFGGNANSKKMQKAILKQQFECYLLSRLRKAREMVMLCPKTPITIVCPSAGVSDEDANHNFESLLSCVG
ncbi:ribonuclease H-like domain-containing protein [Tanacetum coccineum]